MVGCGGVWCGVVGCGGVWWGVVWWGVVGTSGKAVAETSPRSSSDDGSYLIEQCSTVRGG